MRLKKRRENEQVKRWERKRLKSSRGSLVVSLWAFFLGLLADDVLLSSLRHPDCPETPLPEESGRTFHLRVCPGSHSNADGQNGKWPCAHRPFRKWLTVVPSQMCKEVLRYFKKYVCSRENSTLGTKTWKGTSSVKPVTQFLWSRVKH